MIPSIGLNKDFAAIQIRNFYVHADTTVGAPVLMQMDFQPSERCQFKDEYEGGWMWQQSTLQGRFSQLYLTI